MARIFEVEDKSGRKIHLSDERWKHLNQEHPEVAPYLEEIKDILKNPLKITDYEWIAVLNTTISILKKEKQQNTCS